MATPGQSARQYGQSVRTRTRRAGAGAGAGAGGSSAGVGASRNASTTSGPTPAPAPVVNGGGVDVGGGIRNNYDNNIGGGGGGGGGGVVAPLPRNVGGGGNSGTGATGGGTTMSARTSGRTSGGGGSVTSSSRRSTNGGRQSSGGSGTSTSASSIPQIGLREIVRQRILKDVFQNSMDKYKGWMVCVVDDRAMRVMSSVMGMYDLMEQHVSLVESINKIRAPFNDLGVIYVCAPTIDNINQIIDDFSPTNGKKQPLYGKSVFIYFLSKVPNDVLSKLKQSKVLIKRLKALGEINIDFISKQTRAYHLDMNSHDVVMPELYRRPGAFTLTHNTIIEQLVTLCATLNEYPHVRYPMKCPLSQNLAETFQSKMNEFVAQNSNWWYYGMSGHLERDRSTLLLLDRSFDPLTPLMHEFTYQAMVNDLLDIKDDKISYTADIVKGGGESSNEQQHVEHAKKDVLLNDNDELWVELRGKHIADVIQILSNRIKDMVNSNSSAKLATADGQSMTLSQMTNALKQLPEYQEVMSKLSQHMHIAHECMRQFTSQNLMNLADVEQLIATGVDDDRRSVRLNDIVEQVDESLSSLTSNHAKLRLLSIFLASQSASDEGTPDAIKSRLYEAANLSHEDVHQLENGFSKLGVIIDQAGRSNATNIKSMFGNKRRGAGNGAELAPADDGEYTSSRYVPKVKTLMNAITDSTLDMDEYPSVLPMPVGSSGSATSVRAKTTRGGTGSARSKNKKGGFSGPRVLVFVAGGACFSELRSAEEIMAAGEREVMIGSTSFLKPDEYLKDVLDL